MSKYKQIRQYLDSFINYEKQADFAYCRVLKLERMKELLRRCDIACEKLKVIHIAGTKGKGSTAHFCADLLAGAGYKVGLYTSPHFFDFRERIILKYGGEGSKPSRMINQMIPKKDVVRIVGEIIPYLEKLRFSPKLGKLSFFEVYTAVAFKYFVEKGVDFAVLETGMGGRLDATNVVTPLVSIISSISYDHTVNLGTRLRDIAFEKAGIIKSNGLVVCSQQRTAAQKVIKKQCRQMNADLFIYNRDFFATGIKFKRDYSVFDFKFNDDQNRGVKISLKGKRQVENACLGLAAMGLLRQKGFISGNLKIHNDLRNTVLNGRFETVCRSPLVVLDVAHNPDSFLVLGQNLKDYFPERSWIILIFAACKDKDIKRMLSNFSYSSLILTKFNSPRCFDPKELKDKYKLKQAVISQGIKEAFDLAGRIYQSKAIIVISGSFFLVSEAKRILKFPLDVSKKPEYNPK